MDSSTPHPQGKRDGEERPHDAAPEICPRCGTDYCAGCGTAERVEGQCPHCGQALIKPRQAHGE